MLSIDQLGQVLDGTRGRADRRDCDRDREAVPVYGLVILCLAYTGLRAAELAGLEIGNLTLDPPRRRGSVRVTRTKLRTNGEWVVATPKSATSSLCRRSAG